MFAFRPWSSAVIGDSEPDPFSTGIGVLIELYLHMPGIGMLRGVVKCLLDNPVNVCAGLRPQLLDIPAGFDHVARAACRTFIVTCDETFEALEQAEVVDFLGPQISERLAQRDHQGGGHFLEFFRFVREPLRIMLRTYPDTCRKR